MSFGVESFKEYLLDTNQEQSDGGMLVTLSNVEIDGLDVKSNKLFVFGCNHSVRFTNCIFARIQINHSVRVEFVNCTFVSLTTNCATITASNIKAKEINISQWGRFVFQSCNGTIESLIINNINAGHISGVNSILPEVLISGDFVNCKIELDACKIGHLNFDRCTVQSNARLLFHAITVYDELVFDSSILNYTEFHSCDFKRATHIINNSQYDNASFINITWFNKIYTHRNRRNKNLLDKLITRDFVKKWKGSKILGKKLRLRLKYYYRREFYEEYRKYKLIMSAVKNKADEIYFKSKEYNARYKQISYFSTNFSDKIILMLNRFSNNHGRFWLLPICWIFVLGAIFFYGFISNSSIACTEGTGWDLFSGNTAQYLMFLNPTHDMYFLDGNRTVYLQDRAVYSDWSFRIINAYLIFQTISSFRRYKE